MWVQKKKKCLHRKCGRVKKKCGQAQIFKYKFLGANNSNLPTYQPMTLARMLKGMGWPAGLVLAGSLLTFTSSWLPTDWLAGCEK